MTTWPPWPRSSIGERDVRATPLQMAMVAAAVANDGVVMKPYVVAEVFDADGQVVDRHRAGGAGGGDEPGDRRRAGVD